MILLDSNHKTGLATENMSQADYRGILKVIGGLVVTNWHHSMLCRAIRMWRNPWHCNLFSINRAVREITDIERCTVKRKETTAATDCWRVDDGGLSLQSFVYIYKLRFFLFVKMLPYLRVQYLLPVLDGKLRNDDMANYRRSERSLKSTKQTACSSFTHNIRVTWCGRYRKSAPYNIF